MAEILLIDDEAHWLRSLKLSLSQAEIASYSSIYTAQNYSSAVDILKTKHLDLVLLDIVMEGESGEQILKEIKKSYPNLTVVMLTGLGSIRTAAGFMDMGADDYLVKTISTEELTESVKRILKYAAPKDFSTEGQSDISSFEDFVTVSPKMFSLFSYLKALQASSEPVLITGESGVGKGVLAKCASNVFRRGKPFVSLDVSGLDTQMFSDALFGHVKGAFTGADAKRSGIIAQAEDGVLFLDEIGDISLESQLKLLNLTQSRQYRRLGDDEVFNSGARLILATNQDLIAKRTNGTFRKDLYYRIAAHCVNIPPLRERKEDIPFLVRRFAQSAAAEFCREKLEISDNILLLLQSYDFPGNTRELRAIMYDVTARCESGVLSMKDFTRYFVETSSTNSPKTDSENNNHIERVEDVIDGLIERALKLTSGNQTKAAAMIGMSQSAISRRLKKNIK